ncbi:MAG: hypothetical protein QM723_03940 [Myxococcaceae bacterium]
MIDDETPPDDPLDEPVSGDGDDKTLRGVIPELVRKVAVAGLGAVFMTEEGIRALAGQLKLPREVLTYILGQAERTKDQVGTVISEEVRRFLQSDRLRDEFLKLLAGMTIEVKAEVKLVPDRVKGTPESPALMPKVQVHDLKTTYGGSPGKKKKEE